MYRAVSVVILYPSYKVVYLPDCHTGHLMSNLKDRVREKLDVPPGVEIKLGYATGTEMPLGIISVSDDDTVEHVVQEIVQVH